MPAFKNIRFVAAATMILASVSGLDAGEPTTSSTTLRVRIDGLRSARGKVLVYVWNQGDGFPSEKKKTLTVAEVAIQGTQAACEFAIPASEKRLAVSVMHDENGNGKMDSNFLGIPLEGYATSRNVPHSIVGPPRYTDAEFPVGDANGNVAIKMLY
jgi:uncharacterized protein (DUF2141 family)